MSSLTRLCQILDSRNIPYSMLEERGLQIEPGELIPIVKILCQDPDFACDYLALFTASDHIKEEEIHLSYILESLVGETSIWLRIHIPRQGAKVESLTPYFAAANWLEREVYDLYGVHFENHPDLRRILTPSDFQGHGMLKDYRRDGFFVRKPTKISGVKV